MRLAARLNSDGYTIQPIMFVLLFRYVFGGAIGLPGRGTWTS